MQLKKKKTIKSSSWFDAVIILRTFSSRFFDQNLTVPDTKVFDYNNVTYPETPKFSTETVFFIPISKSARIPGDSTPSRQVSFMSRPMTPTRRTDGRAQTGSDACRAKRVIEIDKSNKKRNSRVRIRTLY